MTDGEMEAETMEHLEKMNKHQNELSSELISWLEERCVGAYGQSMNSVVLANLVLELASLSMRASLEREPSAVMVVQAYHALTSTRMEENNG